MIDVYQMYDLQIASFDRCEMNCIQTKFTEY